MTEHNKWEPFDYIDETKSCFLWPFATRCMPICSRSHPTLLVHRFVSRSWIIEMHELLTLINVSGMESSEFYTTYSKLNESGYHALIATLIRRLWKAFDLWKMKCVTRSPRQIDNRFSHWHPLWYSQTHRKKNMRDNYGKSSCYWQEYGGYF